MLYINNKFKLAKIYILENKFDAAKQILLNNLKNLENNKNSGLRLDREENLFQLGIIYTHEKKLQKANNYFHKAYMSFNDIMMKRLSLLTESQKNVILKKVPDYNNVYLSFLYDNKSMRTEKNIRLIYDNITQYKNLTISAFLHTKNQILNSKDEKLKTLFKEYLNLKQEYSKLVIQEKQIWLNRYIINWNQ